MSARRPPGRRPLPRPPATPDIPPDLEPERFPHVMSRLRGLAERRSEDSLLVESCDRWIHLTECAEQRPQGDIETARSASERDLVRNGIAITAAYTVIGLIAKIEVALIDLDIDRTRWAVAREALRQARDWIGAAT